MLFKNTIKQLNWYFKGQISTWGVWIFGYYYNTKTIENIQYQVRSKKISITDSKANRKKFVAATKKFYTEIKFPAYGFQSANDWRYRNAFNSSVWNSEEAHYTCYITLDESKLNYLGLEVLRDKALEQRSYRQHLNIKQYANGASVSTLLGFIVENCLTIEVTNSGSKNKGVDNVDIFPYEFTSKYLNEDDISYSYETEKLIESDCNKYVRHILMKEVALFIDEIVKVKSLSR